MSSQYVKDQFAAAWPGLVPTIPLHDVENVDLNHADKTLLSATWAVTEFVSFNEEPISLGVPGCVREEGVIIVILYVKSGSGTSQLETDLETVRNVFRHWVVPGLRIRKADPPGPGGPSDGNFYSMSVDLNYIYDRIV